MSTKHNQHRKKSSVGKKVAIALISIILIVVLVVAFLISHYAGLFGDLREEERGSNVVETAVDTNADTSTNIANDVFSILLIGVDSRQDTYTGRSDTQMLFSINTKQKKLVITSILRDSYVTIPGNGNNRINAAYALGGTNLLTQTIQSNFGIPVDRCAVVNFKVVSDFVDSVGGVDIDLSEAEIERINNSSASGHLYNAGVNHLNGDQALAYARIRYIDNDFERTKRQRVVVEDALEKVSQMSLSEQNSLLQQYLPRIHTDLTKSEVINLGTLILRLRNYEVQSFALPIDGTWSDLTVSGMQVLDIDFEANRKAWEAAVS